MYVLHNLATVEEYAAMCGVAVTTVYYRHHKGNISSIDIDGWVFVDTTLSPPQKLIHRYVHKKNQHIILPDNIDPKDLVSVFSYAYRKKIRPDTFYGLAAMDKIKSVVAGNVVFILRSEADKIKIKHTQNQKKYTFPISPTT